MTRQLCTSGAAPISLDFLQCYENFGTIRIVFIVLIIILKFHDFISCHSKGNIKNVLDGRKKIIKIKLKIFQEIQTRPQNANLVLMLNWSLIILT